MKSTKTSKLPHSVFIIIIILLLTVFMSFSSFPPFRFFLFGSVRDRAWRLVPGSASFITEGREIIVEDE